DRLASVLHGWCACFAPYMIETADDWFEPLRRSLEGRRWNLAAGDVADMLQVCFEERQALGLRTIAACDLDPEEMRACVADARRERERARAAARREAKTSRTEWLAS